MSNRAPNDYAPGHNHEELQRLIGQGRWLGELTEEVLRAAGIGPGMRVLDVGCGAGDVSFLAATLVGATGSVIGVDRSAEATSLAKRRAADVGLTNVSFVTQDLQDLATEARFDAIVGRLVLMYFPEPVTALRRLLQLLVPGGVVAFHEIDVHGATSEPHLPLFAHTVTRISEALRCSNANPRMGLRLAQTFLQARLPTPRMIAHARIGT
jgi:ubiquinone/menaquinone biosynthesis C-methylase UbiE